jgi:hypothetical protein
VNFANALKSALNLTGGEDLLVVFMPITSTSLGPSLSTRLLQHFKANESTALSSLVLVGSGLGSFCAPHQNYGKVFTDQITVLTHELNKQGHAYVSLVVVPSPAPAAAVIYNADSAQGAFYSNNNALYSGENPQLSQEELVAMCATEWPSQLPSNTRAVVVLVPGSLLPAVRALAFKTFPGKKGNEMLVIQPDQSVNLVSQG